MQCVARSFSVKEASTGAFEALFKELAAKAHAEEPGLLLCQLSKHRKKPGVYQALELFADAAANAAHMHNYGKHFHAQVAPLLSAPPSGTLMPVVGSPGLKSLKGAAKPTIAIVAELSVNDMDGFQAASLPALADVHSKEPGCLLYCLGRDEEQSKFVFLELYTGMPAIQAHGQTPYFKAMGKRQAPFFAGKPKVTMLVTVGESTGAHSKL